MSAVVPIHGRWIDVAPAALDAQVVESEDARAAAYQARQHVLLLDGLRHAPVRMEDHLLHVLREDRRRRVGLAGDDALGVNDLAVLDHAQRELGDVDPDVEVAERLRHPAPLFHVDEQLARVGRGRQPPSACGLLVGLGRGRIAVASAGRPSTPGTSGAGPRTADAAGAASADRHRGPAAFAAASITCGGARSDSLRSRYLLKVAGSVRLPRAWRAYFRMARLSAISASARSARDSCGAGRCRQGRQLECRRLEAPVVGTADLGDDGLGPPA